MGADGWSRYPRMDYYYKSPNQNWENNFDKRNVSDLLHKFVTQVLLD